MQGKFGRSDFASPGIVNRWQPRVMKNQLDFFRANWQTCLTHLVLWWVLVLGGIAMITSAYIMLYNWYIPAERISQPVYLQFDNQRPSYAMTLDGLRPGIPYDVSLQLLVPDIAGLSESLGNVMIATNLKCESTVVNSNRPTLLVYRSWPVRTALLGLRMVPVVLGLAREATTHRVFLMERIVLSAETVTLELAVGQRLPVYEATLEMVAHFTGIRYLMYYWRWVFAGTIIGIFSFGLILMVTIVLGLSLYKRLYPGEATSVNGSSSFSIPSEISETSGTSKISGLCEISESKKGNRNARLRRRRVATEVLVPNGYGLSSEDDLDLDIDLDIDLDQELDHEHDHVE